jgi:hypothetical protein
MSADIGADLRAILRPWSPAQQRALVEAWADAAVESAANAWESGDLDGHHRHLRDSDIWATALEAMDAS